jgi:lipopolysaccharide assembly protein B
VLCGVLLATHPAAFNLVARDYARAALGHGSANIATERLIELQASHPSIDLLNALAQLDPDPEQHRQRLLAQLHTHPTFSAAQALIATHQTSNNSFTPDELQVLTAALGRTAQPLQRYFWQCPGCLSWDSYPPQRLEDL